jgi:hypothetical protein
MFLLDQTAQLTCLPCISSVSFCKFLKFPTMNFESRPVRCCTVHNSNEFLNIYVVFILLDPELTH